MTDIRVRYTVSAMPDVQFEDNRFSGAPRPSFEAHDSFLTKILQRIGLVKPGQDPTKVLFVIFFIAVAIIISVFVFGSDSKVQSAAELRAKAIPAESSTQ
jgi:hypothetical protein